MTRTETTAFVGLGSNQDDPETQLRSAIDEIAALPGCRLLARSGLYRTAPIGFAGQPDFLNAVVEIATTLAPLDLLRRLQSIEAGHGRTRSFRNAPRTLDLDLLLYGSESIDAPELQVPHPRMHERAFVLAPMAEIAPESAIGTRGTAGQLLAACRDQRVERTDR